MTRIRQALLLLLLSLSLAVAQAPAVDFSGDHFVKKFESAKDPAHPFAEFALANESLDAWTKLFAFHFYPRGGNAALAAANLGKLASQRSKNASVRVLNNAATKEAIVSFLAFAPEKEMVEANVFKYAPGPDGNGLVAAQYAFRFKLGEADAAELAKLRQRAIDDLAKFDMTAVRDYFKKSR